LACALHFQNTAMLALPGDHAASQLATREYQILRDLADEVNAWNVRHALPPYFTARTTVSGIRWVLRAVLEHWARGERLLVSTDLVDRILLLYPAPAVGWFRDNVRAEAQWPEDLGAEPANPHGRGREIRWPFKR
jgi:hypothetical protein